jgi:hypothetical protein
VTHAKPSVPRASRRSAIVLDGSRSPPRLSANTTHNGSGNVRSPAADLVEDRRSPFPLHPQYSVVDAHHALVKIHVRPVDAQRLTDPDTSGQQEPIQLDFEVTILKRSCDASDQLRPSRARRTCLSAFHAGSPPR